jgi:hypothetical protein
VIYHAATRLRFLWNLLFGNLCRLAQNRRVSLMLSSCLLCRYLRSTRCQPTCGDYSVFRKQLHDCLIVIALVFKISPKQRVYSKSLFMYMTGVENQPTFRRNSSVRLQVRRTVQVRNERETDLSPTHGAEPFLRSRHSRTSQHFMEPKGSLSRSQEPSTGPYPEP